MITDTDPHWERGFRCHGYWVGLNRIGVVGIPPRPSNVKKDGYGWHFTTSKSEYIEGQAHTLREGKRIIEKMYQDHISGGRYKGL